MSTKPENKQNEEIKDEEVIEAEEVEVTENENVKEEKSSKSKKSKKTDKKPKETEKKEEDKKPDDTAALKEANDKYLRLMAEYDNYRKRSSREKDALYGDIKSDVVTKFLPVYDNLVRALAQSTEDEAYRKGVEMIMTQFEKTMKDLGVTEIESLGKTFDPNLHNAVMHVEDEEKGENEIVEVFQKGFKLGDKVIRFAMVKVAN